jgi:hypothetical protein
MEIDKNTPEDKETQKRIRELLTFFKQGTPLYEEFSGLPGVMIVALAFLFALYLLSDERPDRNGTNGRQCVTIENTKNENFVHVEAVKTQQAGVNVTFDVWGNRFKSLHGFDGSAIAVRFWRLKTWSFESGGFHDDTPHW